MAARNPLLHLTVEETAQNLAAFAVDRTDLKTMLKSLPAESSLNRVTLEYELGILKILAVGWGISFYMPVSDRNKPVLSESFWQVIQEFSQNISTLTETSTGQQIDYFNILKERLDIYVTQMQQASGDTMDPSAVMGPAFARTCGCPDNPVAMLTGSRMFALTLGGVKEYLAAVKIKPPKHN
ncbi:MAG: hypothetical protein RQ739_07210 [Desulfotignum sp.]|nr:hypothetical protein [Desulfotignum sp.]